MQHSTLRTATLLALATAMISGVSNFVNKIAVTGVRDAVLYTTLKNAIVALALFGIIISLRHWRTIVSLTRRQWTLLVAVGVIGGSLPFALFFTGLTMTPALNAALIHKTLIFWIALLAIPILKERVSSAQWLGIAALFAANILVGGFAGFRYNTGELLILAATILWAVENIVAKVALRDIPSTVVAGARMTFGSLILLAVVLWKNPAAFTIVGQLSAAAWTWTFLTAVLLLGYVLAWYRALALAPATYVATLLVTATLVTNALTAIFLTHSFVGMQVVGAILTIVGAIIVVRAARPAPALHSSLAA